MYEKFEIFCGNALAWSLQAGLMALIYLLCPIPSSVVYARILLRLLATQLDCRASVLLNNHVNRVPLVLTGLAVAQIIVIVCFAYMGCVPSPLDAAHLTGSLVLGGFAVWAVLGAGRSAQDVINTSKASAQMKACLIIEREIWAEQSSFTLLLQRFFRLLRGG